MKEQEKCGAQFDEYVCQKKAGHFGKHHDSRENYWQSWTDQGKARVEAERAEKVLKQ